MHVILKAASAQRHTFCLKYLQFLMPIAHGGFGVCALHCGGPFYVESPDLGAVQTAMINNDVLRSIRYMLDIGDTHVVAFAKLVDPTFALEKTDVQAFLRREDDPEYIECSDRVLANVLDGLVIHCRGRNDSLPPRPVEKRISNNLVLKKLRVAFELKDVDMHAIFTAAGFPISKPELSALFRQPGHHNYRECGDQLLRNFLKGLTLRVRGA